MSLARTSAFRVGDCVVHPQLDEIQRGDARQKLEPRAMRLLVLLADRAGEVVGMQELLDAVWRDVVVTQDSVYTAIAALRRALGEDGEGTRYIVTVPKRGYRLVAAVDAMPAADALPAAARATQSAPAPARRRTSSAGRAALAVVAVLLLVPLALQLRRAASRPATTLPSAAVALPAAAVPVPDQSVAVLPFVDMSAAGSEEYFADGLAEELIDQLAHIDGLRVPARTSAFFYKKRPAAIADIARSLGVAYVLEGSVRREGRRVRVTAQLIRAQSGYHVWSQTYDRDLDDVFRVQDGISQAVVAQLKVHIARQAGASPGAGTASGEAYAAYLQGRAFRSQGNVEGYRQAIGAYRRALELDAGYADAWAMLAQAEAYLGDATADPGQIEAARHDAGRAIAAGPDRAAGYSVRGFIRSAFDLDWRGAGEDLRRAVDISPSDANVLNDYGLYLSYLRRGREALPVLARAATLDPLAADPLCNIGNVYASEGDWKSARPYLERAVALQPGYSIARMNLAQELVQEGSAGEARRIALGIEDEAQRLPVLAMAEHGLGHEVESRQALQSLIDRHADGMAYQVAEVLAWRGERALALDWLERAWRQHDGGIATLVSQRLFEPLRGEPRFRELVRRAGFAER